MTDPNPHDTGAPKPDDFTAKAEKLGQDAVEAGKKFLETDTGKKVAEATDSAFQSAEDLARQLRDSELGQKALGSDLGQQATRVFEQASEKAKTSIPNELGRNIAVGAAAGAVLALPIPFIGSLLGAVIGGGLGYLRTITKKS